MKKKIKLNNGYLYPLFLILLFSFSCKKKESNIAQSKVRVIEQNDFTKRDSITISVTLSSKEITGFNIMDNYFQNYFSEFHNISSKDTIITKKKLRIYKREVILYRGGYIDNGKIVSYQHYYLALKNLVNLNFKYVKGDLILANSDNVIIVDNLYNDYKRIDSKIFNIKDETSKENLKKELDSIYNLYKNEYTNLDYKEAIKDLNYIYYLSNLQGIYPNDDRIENYLIKTKEPIASSPHSGLLYTYAKNRMNSFNFKKLNTEHYSKEYLNNISIGLFNFLRYENNRGDKQYQDAISWLKTTDLYKQDSIYIKKEITPLNNTVFKDKLKKLVLLNTSFKKLSFSEMIINYPSNYYLIDFWATWCSPCIEGVNIMKKMKFPKNVKVISLSLDKIKVKGKWKTKTKELEQKISFLVDEKNQKNREFLKFIELQSVPRYILIDKNMNLIDEAFSHPNEPQFLPKLKDVKNSKYW